MELFPFCLISAMVLCFMGFWWQRNDSNSSMICYDDFTNETRHLCKRNCNKHYVSVVSMDSCLPMLTCEEIQSKDFKVITLLGNSATKTVNLVEWKGHKLVLNLLHDPVYRDDFYHGLNMLEGLQCSSHVTQLIGKCGDSYVTEYYPLGSADCLSDHMLDQGLLSGHNSVREMLKLCVNYVEIVHFLHTSPIGVRVICDSNSVEKTLSQFLIREDLTLIINDLDALPEVKQSAGMLIKCGHRQILGEFVAPEQLWPFNDRPFDDDYMPGYDEKTDIWKIPSVCEHFLSLSPQRDIALFHLFSIHKRCKSWDPADRPTALDVLNHYKAVLGNLGDQPEL